MRILQRRYLKDFFAALVIIAFGISLIFTLIDLIGKIDDFLPSKPSLGSLLLYAVYSLPKFFVYLLPMSVLICSLFVFGQATKRKEVIAIKAAGGRLRDLFLPFVITGLLISVTAFFISEGVAPDFATRAADLRTKLEGQDRTMAFSEGALWVKDSKGNPVRFELYIPDRKLARDISIFVQGDTFLKETITAKKALWDGNSWVLQKVVIHETETGKVQTRESMAYPDLESPDIFSREMKTSDEMGLLELYRYIERLRSAGFNNIKLFVDLNAKISFPLINFFMMLLGISLAGRMSMSGGLFTAGLGLAISLAYWFGYTFTLSVGYAGILPPILSAWTVPAVFGGLALHLFIRMPE